MIINWCEQNTEEWAQARLGVVTASEFSKFITPKTMQKSAGWFSYACTIAAERITGKENGAGFSNAWTDRGHALEDEALSIYELYTDAETYRVGMVYADESMRVACSPDALVESADGQIGGCEVKCLGQTKHMEHLMSGGLPVDHFHQVQGSLWITGLPWWDFISYHPDIKPLIVRCHPDKSYFALLNTLIPDLLLEIDIYTERGK